MKLYSRPDCSLCIEAKNFLSTKKIPYETHSYDDLDELTKTEIKSRGITKLPVIEFENSYCRWEDAKKKIYDRYSKLEMLKNELCTVLFEKADGSERRMKCTLVKGFIIDSDTHEFDDTRSQINNSNCVVWDMDEDGWRSFRWNSVKEFKIAD